MTCALLDLGCHLQSSFWAIIGAVPWWVWIAIAVAGVGVAYRIGGWPAVVAMAFGYGVLWGGKMARDDRRVDAPREPAPRRKRPTLVDLFNRKR